MTAASPTEAAPPAPGVVRWFNQGENLVLTVTLGLMVLLPVLEVLLRRFFSWGISGSTAWVQHGTLLVGMVGGAVAARQKRLLSLATADYLKGRWKTFSTVFSQGFAAAVTTLLCVAGVRFVLEEMPGGKVLSFGVPFWVLQAFIPLGFALVAARLIWHASPHWKGRAGALAVALVALAIGLWTPISPEKLKWPGIAVLLLATAMGAPVFSTIGGAAMILFWGDGQTIDSMPIDHYSLVTNPSLPTIPLFTLAGYFLAEGGAPQRLIRVFNALFGQLRGGPAIVTAVACAFFTSFTGASGVTILALGGLLMPVLLAARFSERSALGLLTGAGSLGLLFPPCLPVILYAIVANKTPQTNISIEQMFLAGLGPGILLVLLTVGWGLMVAPARAAQAGRFDAREAGRAVWAAKWELLLPAVAVVALFSGWVTTVEAAAITALYAFVVETVIYRDLKFGR
jgi:TRAP-type C4-dicarboxylate transport system permease small subunit